MKATTKTKRIKCSCVNHAEAAHNRSVKENASLRKHRLDKLGRWVCLTCGRLKAAV